MSHLVTPLLEVLFRWLGIERGVEFSWVMVVYLALFFFYAGRQITRTPVYSILYLVGGISGAIALFTVSPRTRAMSAAVLAATMASAFMWYFATRRRA